MTNAAIAGTLVVVGAIGYGAGAHAQRGGGTSDPVKVDAKHYKVEFENEKVRVLRISYAPGEKSVMHHHPDGVAVNITDDKIRMTTPDGKSQEQTAKAGSVTWAPGGDHLPQNVGEKPFEVVLVELKK